MNKLQQIVSAIDTKIEDETVVITEVVTEDDGDMVMMKNQDLLLQEKGVLPLLHLSHWLPQAILMKIVSIFYC